MNIINIRDQGYHIVYLAGPITGISNYKETFNTYETFYQNLGFIVLNPATLPEGLKDYMDICYKMIDQADAVIFLPKWQVSIGANLEMRYCLQTNKPFYNI